jgi:hypothetical protein
MSVLTDSAPLIWETEDSDTVTGIRYASVNTEGDLFIQGKNFTWTSMNHFVDPNPVQPANKKNSPAFTNGGAEGEEKTWQLFLDMGVPPEFVYKPAYIRVDGVGDYEISDGVIIYGDTAFLLQIKTRTTSVEGRDVDWLRDKLRDSRCKAYSQAISSLDLLKEKGGAWFENFNGERHFLRAEDYNWTALIVLAYNELIPAPPVRYAVQEDASETLNRLTITLKELRDISTIYGNPLLLLNYLRRVQYQGVDCIGYEVIRFFQMLDAGIYPTQDNEPCIVQMIDEALLNYRYPNGAAIEPNKLREIFYAIDYMSLEDISHLQKEFGNDYRADTLRKLSFAHDGVATTIVTTSDNKMPSSELATSLALEAMTSYKSKHVKYSLCIFYGRNEQKVLGISLVQIVA